MKTPSTYTNSGVKSTASAKLPTSIFGVIDINQNLLKDAYVAYLANARVNLAVTKKRGEVRGGGKKPWKQKGTGRARFGSSRVPIWRGGGITFGPTGDENYKKNINTATRRNALRQALSLANESGKILVVQGTGPLSGKTNELAKFLSKIEAKGKVLYVVDSVDMDSLRATSNIPDLKVSAANYLTVYDIVNADSIVLSGESIEKIVTWLGSEPGKLKTKLSEVTK